jgi:hypothetical protein
VFREEPEGPFVRGGGGQRCKTRIECTMKFAKIATLAAVLMALARKRKASPTKKQRMRKPQETCFHERRDCYERCRRTMENRARREQCYNHCFCWRRGCVGMECPHRVPFSDPCSECRRFEIRDPTECHSMIVNGVVPYDGEADFLVGVRGWVRCRHGTPHGSFCWECFQTPKLRSFGR